jgi:hypothetical protein
MSRRCSRCYALEAYRAGKKATVGREAVIREAQRGYGA